MIPSLLSVELARWQFAFVACFHFIFVPLTLGLTWIIFTMELMYVITGKQVYKDMTKFWGKLLGINNAEAQPLSLLRLGLPNNTHTQEGLAIFSEYLSGNLTIKRLHELALRVIAVEHMIKHMQFSKTYHYLRSISGLESHACFRLVARVYRGGGFSKDFLYLSGLREIIDAHQKMDINLLFTGKTSLKYLDNLHKIAKEGYLIAPKLIPVSYQSPTVDADDQIIRYLMQSIK